MVTGHTREKVIVSKKLLYVSSSRNRTLTGDNITAAYESVPFGHIAMLRGLGQLGWHIRMAGWHGSWNPVSLARRITRFSPDLIFANSVTSLSAVWAQFMSSGWHRPVVLGWDDFYEDIWRTCFGPVAGHFMHWLEPRIVRASDYVITISRYQQERAKALGKKTWYIPNGCDFPEFDVTTCKHTLQGELNLVYCGDQGRYKRTYEIVQAMSRVPEDIKLYLVGTPYKYLQPLASKNVIFLGRLPENDKWSIMSQADVLVCTANTDCNAKFHEYLRIGKPILGYDGIANHLFQNRRNALLTRDYPATIMELYRSPELRAEIAANAARDIPVYTWREIAEQYDRAFAEILDLHDRNDG